MPTSTITTSEPDSQRQGPSEEVIPNGEVAQRAARTSWLAAGMTSVWSSDAAAAAFRAGASPDLADAAMLGGGVAAFAGAVAVAALPAVRNLVLPPPRETYLADLLQFHSVLEDGRTIKTKDGALVQTVMLAGCDTGGKSTDELDALLIRRKTWFEKLAENGLFVKILTTRERAVYELPAEYENPVLQAIHERWTEQFTRVFVNRHVLVFTVAKDGRNERRALAEAVRDACDALSPYDPIVLELGSGHTSPLLSFWATLVNGFHYPMAPFRDRLSQRMASTTIHFGREHGLIEHQDGAQSLYTGVMSLSEWGEESSGAILRDLLRLDGRLTVLQFVKGHPKADAVLKLRHSARQAMLLMENRFVAADFEEASDHVEGDQGALLEHQLSIFLSADTRADLEALVAAARRVFLNYGLRPAVEVDAAEWLWRCRLPGFDKFVRTTTLLSHNLAHLCTFEAEPAGLPRSDWGEGPLRLFKTVSGGAFSLQLHISDQDEALAHSATIAPAGSGKTTLFEHLIGGALRHERLRAYIFDRFDGTKIFTQAAGGTYIDLRVAESADGGASLNPLQIDDTSENRQFLHQFLMQLAGVTDDESREVVTRALDAIFSVPKAKRSLNHVYQSGFDTGSTIKRGLQKWVGDSPHAGWNASRRLRDDGGAAGAGACGCHGDVRHASDPPGRALAGAAASGLHRRDSADAAGPCVLPVRCRAFQGAPEAPRLGERVFSGRRRFPRLADRGSAEEPVPDSVPLPEPQRPA
jgi:type IV secretory pathway VirB4 component